MNKPTLSVYELGLGLGVVAGMDAAEPLTRPVEGRDFKVAGIFDTSTIDEVRTYLAQVDAAADSLDGDVQRNAKAGEAFKSSWKIWLSSWKAFLAKHESLLQISIAGRDATMKEARGFQTQLEGWRQAYAREGGAPPSGVMPEVPKNLGGDPTPDGKSPWSLSWSTKILLALGGFAVVGGLGYMTYRYLKRARDDSERAQSLAKKLGESILFSRFGGGGGFGGGFGGGGEASGQAEEHGGE